MTTRPTSLRATVPTSNPTRVTADTPLTIFPAGEIRYWGNADNIVLGTPPDITTMTDLTAFGRDPTQGTAASRPHLLDVGGKSFADFDNGANNFLRVVAGTPFFTSGTATVTCWCIARFDTADTQVMFDVTNDIGDNTGLSLRYFSTGVLRARVVASGLVTLDSGAHPTGVVSIFEVSYDGTDFKIIVDGTEVATTSSATGGMGNTCEVVTIGREGVGGSGRFNGPLREMVLHAGATAPSSAERAKMFAYLQSRLP